MFQKFQKGFLRFINIALMIIFIPIIIWAFYKAGSFSSRIGTTDLVLLGISLVIIVLVAYLQKKNIKGLYIVSFIAILGFALRFMYIISIDSVPISDYKTMMDVADLAVKGQFDAYKGLSYMARFPHLITPTLYFSTIMKLTSNYLWIIKVINVILSTLNIITMYFIGKEVFNSKRKGQWTALIMAIFPPVIIYTATYAPENLAMPFYLLSAYFVIRVVKNKVNHNFMLLAGVMLALGNVFRAVALVMLVAIVMYIWICSDDKSNKKLINTARFVVPFFITIVLWSSFLLFQNVTDRHLWNSAEPSITNILKGTNIESGGAWNVEDAELVGKYLHDKDLLAEKSREKIIERLTTTPIDELAVFYGEKLITQWRTGDFSAAYWAEHSVVDNGKQLFISKEGIFFIQCFYIGLLLLGYIGLFNRKHNFNFKTINLFYIALGGYGMFYLISEMQERYAFIVCWLFVIFAVNGLDVLTVRFLKDE